MKKFEIVCLKCGAVQPQAYTPFCEKCNYLTEINYDLSAVRLSASTNPFSRFFELLPVKERTLLPAEYDYTPTVHAKSLGKILGTPELYLKNETVHATGTTKYRMAAVALAYLFESGVRHFCTSSTGNSSTAYATLIKNIPDLRMSLFTGSDFRSRVNYADTEQIDHYILKGGTFVEAFDCASVFAAEHAYTSERGFFNVGRREGLKLAFFEATDQIDQDIDWYVQGVSSAMGVYGTYKGAKELRQLGKINRVPRLLCAQQETCSPMVDAWLADSEKIRPEHIVANPVGIAKAILRGNPSRVYPYMREIVKESRGGFAKVSDRRIRQARQLVLDHEGIDICFSAATAVAGLIKMRDEGFVPAHDTILINLTGSDRPQGLVPRQVIFLEKTSDRWVRSAKQEL
jgi:threonine synthase